MNIGALEEFHSQVVNGRIQPLRSPEKARTYIFVSYDENYTTPLSLMPLPLSMLPEILQEGDTFEGIQGIVWNGRIIWATDGDDAWSLKEQSKMLNFLSRVKKYEPQPQPPVVETVYWRDWFFSARLCGIVAAATFVLSYLVLT